MVALTRGVLRCIVVEGTFGDDLEGRKGPGGIIPQDSHRDLDPGDELLAEHLAVGRGDLPGGHQSLRVAHQRQPDRRPSMPGLHHERVAELGSRARHGRPDLGGRDVSRGERSPWWRGDPPGGEEALGGDLVEAERGGEQAAAGVRQAEQLAHPLDGAVLAEAAVDSDEDAVEAARLERGPELGIDLQGRALMSPRPQRSRDLGPGAARDVDLGTPTAADHGDAEAHRNAAVGPPGRIVSGGTGVGQLCCPRLVLGAIAARACASPPATTRPIGPSLTTPTRASPIIRPSSEPARRARRSPVPGERRNAPRRFAGSGRRAPARRRRSHPRR